MTATFPQAPLRSRTVGLPESGSDLGLSSHGLPEARRLKRWLVSTPHHSSLPVGLGRFMDTVYPGSKTETVRGPPSAQSPFAHLGCYLRRRGVSHLVSRRYPAFIARTGSCARPKPSRRLRSMPWSAGLCRLSPVPAGRWPFPTLSLQSLRRCLYPYPAASFRCTCSFLPRRQRPHVRGETFGTPDDPCNATSTEGFLSRLQ